MDTQKQTSVKFYLDPACPWCWRTNLWIRQVEQTRPVQVEWDFFSLSMVNKQSESLAGLNSPSEAALRTLVLARRQSGNAGVARLYLAIGQAHHERKVKLDDHEMIGAALSEAGLAPNLLEQALADPTTLEEINRSHNYVVGLKAFGVPTMILSRDGQESLPVYGPVITEVPSGEEAGQLWDHVAYMTWQPTFFELKRTR